MFEGSILQPAMLDYRSATPKNPEFLPRVGLMVQKSHLQFIGSDRGPIPDSIRRHTDGLL